MTEDKDLEAYLKNAPETAIGIHIPDPTYTEPDENDDWKQRRERFRKQLESEYGLPFRESNIGPGADWPTLVAWLELFNPLEKVALALLATFFLGKKINENLEAWLAIYQKYLKPFLKYKPVFDRKGAILLGFLVEQLGYIPSSCRLIAYGTISVMEEDYMNSIGDVTEIANEPEPMFLGFVVQVFQVEVDDGATFRITVELSDVKLTKM